MLKIYNLKDKPEYIEEVAILTQKEWGNQVYPSKEFNNKVTKKIEKIKLNFSNPYYSKLILLNDSTLIGFISIFQYDIDNRYDLSPCYSTMFIKEDYRNRGYSKILNSAILKEARNRDFKKIYLKTSLSNYYEKFGAKYLEDLNDNEKIYYFEL